MLNPRAECFLIVALLSSICIAGEPAQGVLPEGMAPFDPAPLMTAVSQRIKGDKYRFAVLGDVRHAKNFSKLTAYLDETVKPDFVLTTGDMVYRGGGESGLSFWNQLANESGEEMRKRPWWPAIGNHEIAGDPITGKQATKSEAESPIAKHNRATGTENFTQFYGLKTAYYSFGFRNAVFIALPFPLPNGVTALWLEDELKRAAAENKDIFVFNHMPFYTVGSKPADQVPNKSTRITQLLSRYGVRAVFSGHDHGYYRTIRDGITYITSAGGGAELYPGLRMKEALADDIYYYGVPESFTEKTATHQYVLHKGSALPDRISTEPELFAVVVDVDGRNVSAYCVTATGDRWDEFRLSK